MRVRLRPAYTPEELAALYPAPHDHRKWPDHHLRVAVTIDIAKFLFTGGPVADLSCGNGIVATSLGASKVTLGDLAPGYQIQGPIEQTIDRIDRVALFILGETLEHLDDPDMVLGKIRERTGLLVLSTPDGETNASDNPEHYWGWDCDGVRNMLVAAGFNPVVRVTLGCKEYGARYQIWGCR